jgi:ubiquinone/menaquinone biosynthesis C-methylase UbiE
LEVLISDRGLKNLEIEAVDNNQGMLARARRKTVRVKTKFHQVDLDQPLPYPSSHFDRVVAIHVLYALKNPETALREFFRVLRPSGLLVLTNPHEKSRPSELMKANLAGLNLFEKIRLLLTKLPLIIVNLLICRLAQSGTYHFLSEAQMKHLLEKVGFGEISTELAYANQDLLITARRP